MRPMISGNDVHFMIICQELLKEHISCFLFNHDTAFYPFPVFG